VKNRNLDVLLKVRKAKEGQTLAAFGAERLIVVGLTAELDDATSNLAHLLAQGKSRVDDIKMLAARRASSAACIRQINDALLLARMRTEDARRTWLAADQDREIGQRLVDREHDIADAARDRTESLEADERARGRHLGRDPEITPEGNDS
jgi:hypothetical protein